MPSQFTKTTRSSTANVTPVTRRDQGITFLDTLPWCKSPYLSKCYLKKKNQKTKTYKMWVEKNHLQNLSR